MDITMQGAPERMSDRQWHDLNVQRLWEFATANVTPKGKPVEIGNTVDRHFPIVRPTWFEFNEVFTKALPKKGPFDLAQCAAVCCPHFFYLRAQKHIAEGEVRLKELKDKGKDPTDYRDPEVEKLVASGVKAYADFALSYYIAGLKAG